MLAKHPYRWEVDLVRYEQSGIPFTVTAQGCPKGSTTVGVTVMDTSSNVLVARALATEIGTLTGTFRKSLTVTYVGEIIVQWDTGGASPTYFLDGDDIEILAAAPVPPVPSAGLIAEALTTVADMEPFLDRVGQNGATETAWLEDLINEVSLACARYVDRQFTPERTGPGTRWPLQSDPLATGVSKTFRYDGNGYLDLSPYEVRTVTAVVMGADLATGSQVTLSNGDASTEAEYRLEPSARTVLGTYLWLAVPIAAYSRIPWLSIPGLTQGGRLVKVTGDWGAAPGLIPPDVQKACKISVGQDFRNPEDYATRTGPGMTVDESVSPEGPGALAPASMKLLSAYKRG